jgi:hypothetical protein
MGHPVDGGGERLPRLVKLELALANSGGDVEKVLLHLVGGLECGEVGGK